MRAAGLHGHEPCAAPHIEHAYPLGPVKFVGRKGEQIHAKPVHVQVEGPTCLDGIGVEGDTRLTRDLADLGDGLDGAHLIVGVYDADQGRIVTDSTLDLVRVDQPVSVDGQKGGFETKLISELFHRVAHRVMLDRGRDQVLFAALCLGQGDAAQGQVVALGAASSKDDLPIRATEDTGNRVPGSVERIGCLTPLVV